MGATENNGLERFVFKPSQLELLAASLRLNNADIDNSMNSLAELLQSISPEGIKIKRRRKTLLSKETVIDDISVQLNDQIYSVIRSKSGNAVRCSRSKVVREIVIKTDELTMDKWAASLAHQLAKEAEQSEIARATINKMLGLN